jgi:glycosyltransferase involved in cell wall biosynthesis
VAKFSEREALWQLSKAFVSLRRRDVILVLVGDREQRVNLHAYAERHAHGKVIFTGYMAYTQLPSIYGVGDVFVHPARHEPLAASVWEDMACGLAGSCIL